MLIRKAWPTPPDFGLYAKTGACSCFQMSSKWQVDWNNLYKYVVCIFLKLHNFDMLQIRIEENYKNYILLLIIINYIKIIKILMKNNNFCHLSRDASLQQIFLIARKFCSIHLVQKIGKCAFLGNFRAFRKFWPNPLVSL